MAAKVLVLTFLVFTVRPHAQLVSLVIFVICVLFWKQKHCFEGVLKELVYVFSLNLQILYYCHHRHQHITDALDEKWERYI